MNDLDTVAIHRCPTYEAREVRAAVEACVASLGNPLPKRGAKVLVKPNMLVPVSPDRAVTTHPGFVRAVLQVLKDQGLDVTVGDSPGFGSCRQAAEFTGIAGVCRETGVRIASFNRTAVLENPLGTVWRKFDVASEVVEADTVINLPKLKTHGLTRLTFGVKNLFGCVPGLGKQNLHLKVHDPALFSAMLVDLCQAVRPSLTLADAIVSMDGNGPRNGRPVQTGLILGSQNPYALDVVACEVVGFPPGTVPTVAAAHHAGLGPLSATDIRIAGTGIDEARVKDFRPPRAARRSTPPLLRSLVRDYLVLRPEIAEDRCRNCRVCVEVCPAKAITQSGVRMGIDYAKCIRCYCCDEMCPNAAIALRRPLVRIFRR